MRPFYGKIGTLLSWPTGLSVPSAPSGMRGVQASAISTWKRSSSESLERNTHPLLVWSDKSKDVSTSANNLYH